MVSWCSLVIAMTFLGVTLARTKDFCDPALQCGAGKINIGCKNSGAKGPKCPADFKLISLSAANINKCLDVHNKLRAQVASGSLNKFSPAINMSVVTWDKELAYLAELNAKACLFKHDCKKTAEFRLAGQNIALGVWDKKGDVNSMMEARINSWFKENENCNMDHIKDIRTHNSTTTKEILHFTAIVGDNLTKIGCAMSTYTGSMFKKTYNLVHFVCNYSYSNLSPIYKPGKAASACAKGRSSVYRGLCNP